jgi:hypothetical protein
MENKTIRLQIRTTPKIKKWMKKNGVSQTEVFESAIEQLMKKEQHKNKKNGENKDIKIKKLKEEIRYLNNLLREADDCSWEHKGLIEDVLNGTWNGQRINEVCEGDLKYAKWVAKRYGYKIKKDKDGDYGVIE